MKASLLAISISSVLVAPAFATAPQVDVELANQQTLQLIDGQMKAVDASVQYKLNEQYANATPGTTATIDDVTYEKQSNGTWAAVGAASAALVAGLLSSSSSSNSSDNGNTTPELPVTTSMDSVGTWKVADNDSGYIVTIAGQDAYVDSSNVILNNDGTATIILNDRKLTLGVNGNELYRVDQVSHPDLDIPDWGDTPEFGNDIIDQGWTRVDIGAGVQDFYRFEKVTEDGVKTVEVNDQRKHNGGVHVSVNGGDWKHFDGSKIAAAKDFIDEHLKPADMPQLSDPEYGNGIVGQGWTRVDIGAGVQDFYRFEKVTEDGVKTVEVNDQRKHNGGVHVSVNGGDWKHFDGSKIAAAKDFIDEHLKPADMPQIDPPAKPTISAGLEGDNIVITVNGKSQTTDYTAEADDRGIVHIKDRHGNIVGEGYIDEVNGTVTFGNGIVVNDRGDVTLPPTVKNNVKDKAQSIDPAKLQKAKSAIQQRLRG